MGAIVGCQFSRFVSFRINVLCRLHQSAVRDSGGSRGAYLDIAPIQFGYRLWLTQRRNKCEMLENILNCPLAEC